MMSISGDSWHEIMAKAYNSVKFILEDLDFLLCRGQFIEINKALFASFLEDLKLIKSFLNRVQETSIDVYPDVEKLVLDIPPVLHKLLVAVDSHVAERNKIFTTPTVILLLHYPEISRLAREIKSVERRYGFGYRDDDPTEARYFSRESLSGMGRNSGLEAKILVGFNDEARELRDKLIGGRKQLEVLSIVGMAGIGKTTLAKRLYDDLPIVYHFHTRIWTCVSQVYQKRKLLISILSSVLSREDPVFHMSDEEMGEKLYKCLKGHKYLIVIDDMWDVGAWNDLEMYFPRDENCSRILITSRIKDVALKVRPDSPPHCLRFLTEDESWNLFKQKVFGNRSCPEELIELGRRIVAKCKGLPLAIVVIAGLLAREMKTQEWWRQVAEKLGSSIQSNSEQFMNILALSYKHLPSSLKSCFLYVGSFPEDYEIPVRKLIQSWIAEGFIQQTDERRLEDIAEGYLMDLINRSLVIVARKRSDGGVKSCHIHDTLRELCLRKDKEKKFMLPICKCVPNVNPFQPDSVLTIRSWINKTDPHFSYCQYFHSYNWHYLSVRKVFTNETLAVYKLLRALDLRHIILDNFPKEMLQLHHLKYLALQLQRLENLPTSLFDLWYLETCILDAEKGGRVTLPCDIFKMPKLRHLKLSQELLFEDHLKPLPKGQQAGKQNATPCTILENLQTLSQLCPSGFATDLLAGTPNLRKLALHLTLSGNKEPFSFLNLVNLDQLETLKFEYQTFDMVPVSIPHLDMFPPNLKKLTLVGSHVDWKEMNIIGLLPKLEVLKIKDDFFSGPHWETSDDGFPCLKFLKLSHLHLQEWTSSSSHFPKLEKLVLNGCLNLREIPSGIGDISTLQIIEVYRSSESTIESARHIQESHSCIGNDDFKLYIYHHFEEY